MFNRGKHSQLPKREKLPEECLRTERLQVERKLFFFDLKENPRGRYLRVTEDANGQRDFIILPIAGLKDFHDIVGRMLEFEIQNAATAEDDAEVKEAAVPQSQPSEQPAGVQQ